MKKIDIDGLRRINEYIINKSIRGKTFINGTIDGNVVVAIDGTQILDSKKKKCNGCLTMNKCSVAHYTHNAAVMSLIGNAPNIALDLWLSMFFCKKHLPLYGIIVLQISVMFFQGIFDVLACNSVFIKECIKLGINVIVRVKKTNNLSLKEAKEAIKVANNFLSEIGITDRYVEQMVGSVLSENSSEIISYVLQYGKKFNQIEIPYAVQLGGTLSNNIVTDINGFSEPFHFERLTLEVKDDEIILFTWYNIYTEKDIIKENVALMPFDEMMKNAENQLAVKYAYLENQDLSYMLYVDEIYLTYAVEPIKEEINIC